MQQIRVLAVAPYEGMAESIMSVAQERNDIEMTVKIGDLNTGKEIALESAHKNYDVILSRGGTAELIRSKIDLPVVDIPISGFDILQSIKLSQNYSGKCIIAGFSGITSYAKKLCELLQYDIDILTFSSEEQASSLLRNAQKSGCTLVLCDMTGFHAAKRLKMNSILITSGKESIATAIQDAVKLVRSSQYVHKQKELFQALLTCQNQNFLIYDPAGSLWFSSMIMDETNVSIMNFVQTYLAAFLKISNQTVERRIRDKIYTLNNYHLYYQQQKFTAVIITQKDALFSENDTSIIIQNKDDLFRNTSINYYSNSNHMEEIAHMIESYGECRLPVLISGEIGTGKDQVAAQLYDYGPFRTSPLYTINCENLSDRKWNQIITNDNSPLNAIHSTIYFRHPDALSPKQTEQLIEFLNDSKLARQNRIIFSFVQNNNETHHAQLLKNYLKNHLSCLTLQLPPLREHMQDFSNITALYLHILNLSLGKQIIGFETEAMELMSAFPWPYNLDQLQRILKELIIITDTPYISSKSVKQILSQETSSSTISSILNLNQTLDEINYQIILSVLQDENGNKEKTARRLGISRSTLWRVLKNNENKT